MAAQPSMLIIGRAAKAPCPYGPLSSNVRPQMAKAPLLWPSAKTPQPEVAAIKDLNAHLIGLEYSAKAWEAGLLLYETAKQPPASISRDVASRWRFIACNECVLELYHLRARLAKIQSVQLRKCPSLLAWVDMTKVRGARKRLDDNFPGIEALRHATAHKGENEAHPEVHAPDGQFALTGLREPDVFSALYEGKLYRLAITGQTLEQIDQVLQEFLAGFARAAAELEMQGHLD